MAERQTSISGTFSHVIWRLRVRVPLGVVGFLLFVTVLCVIIV